MKRREASVSALEALLNEAVALALRSSPSPDAASHRLDELGADIGRRLAERLTRDKGRFGSDLETVRFVCKDLWSDVFGKTADGLKTDKKGTFQVEDKLFRLLLRVSPGSESAAKDAAQPYVLLPCGLIRGALDHLGFEGTRVVGQIVAAPHVKFTITVMAQK